MRYEYLPQSRFIIDSLIRMIETPDADDSAERPYSTAIGCGIDELVKHNMRQLSQQQAGMRNWQDLLRAAGRTSAEQLQGALDAHQLTFDLDRYLDHTMKSLEPAAKEMSGLRRKLTESRERRRIGDKTPSNKSQSDRHYEVSELGLLGSIDGLLATPASDVSSLDVDRIREVFRVEGDWFPFEARADDLLFVIDDDGAVFISTENFPADVLDRARTMLHRLAGILYS